MKECEHFSIAGQTPVMNFIIIILVIAVVVVVLYVIFNYNSKNKNMTNEEGEIPENLDGQILAMLTQFGGEMKQSEICANLNLSVKILADELNRLEKEGRIRRRWLKEDYTFSVIG